jgi:hypothetical protein
VDAAYFSDSSELGEGLVFIKCKVGEGLGKSEMIFADPTCWKIFLY